jgi:uncharacterized protein (UPF0333 family)
MVHVVTYYLVDLVIVVAMMIVMHVMMSVMTNELYSLQSAVYWWNAFELVRMLAFSHRHS